MTLIIHKRHIVIADDDMDDRAVIEHAFNKHFILDEITFAEDGTQLLDYLLKTGTFNDATHKLPDLILLDINMPKMSGMEALERIKLHPRLKSIPVIMLTTSSSSEEVRRAYELGASSFIMKPNRLEEYIDMAKRLGEYWFKLVRLP